VWWRLFQHGVVEVGGHGWAPKKGVGCVCGWLPDQAAPSTVRALQLREHVFWGRAGAREVRGVLQRQLFCTMAYLSRLLEPICSFEAPAGQLSSMLHMRGTHKAGVCLHAHCLPLTTPPSACAAARPPPTHAIVDSDGCITQCPARPLPPEREHTHTVHSIARPGHRNTPNAARAGSAQVAPECPVRPAATTGGVPANCAVQPPMSYAAASIPYINPTVPETAQLHAEFAPARHAWAEAPPPAVAAPPGVGGSVSGRLDGHAVGQQAAAPLLWSGPSYRRSGPGPCPHVRGLEGLCGLPRPTEFCG